MRSTDNALCKACGCRFKTGGHRIGPKSTPSSLSRCRGVCTIVARREGQVGGRQGQTYSSSNGGVVGDGVGVVRWSTGMGAASGRVSSRLWQYRVPDPWDPESKKDSSEGLGPVSLRLGQKRRQPAPHLKPKEPKPQQKARDPFAGLPNVPKAKPRPAAPKPAAVKAASEAKGGTERQGGSGGGGRGENACSRGGARWCRRRAVPGGQSLHAALRPPCRSVRIWTKPSCPTRGRGRTCYRYFAVIRRGSAGVGRQAASGGG